TSAAAYGASMSGTWASPSFAACTEIVCLASSVIVSADVRADKDRLKHSTANEPNTAIARTLDSRPSVLLIPDANPTRSDDIELITVVLKGATVIPMASPIRTRAGK